MNFDSLFQLGITQRQKRLGFQISGKDGEPDSRESEDRRDVHQTGHGVGGELRTGEPKEIDEAHENEPDGDFRQQLRAALEVAGQERKEWHKKMEDQDEDRDKAPASVKARAIEADFFGQVAGPDNQKLRKAEVGPEHDKSEKEFAEVVQVAALDEAFHGRRAREQDKDGDHQRHRRD